MRKIIFHLIITIIMISCKQVVPSMYEQPLHASKLYCVTVKQLNDVVLENNFPPMIASRNYVYANIAAYEVIAATDSRFSSLSGQIKHMPKMPTQDASKKIDAPLAAMLAFTKVGNAVTFPEGSLMKHYDHLLHLADSLGMPDDQVKASREYADTVAGAILAWSHGDHYVQTRTAPRFNVTQEEGRWVPTPPLYAQALEPHWKEIRTMVLDSASQCRAAEMPSYNVKDKNSPFYQAVMEVVNTGKNLTEDQKHIADFWDDNPFKMNVTGHVMFATKKFSPPGHWMNIVGIGAEKANADFATTVYAYAKTSIALFDGFISCWEGKYHWNSIRPESVINQLIAPDWQPYIQTPPFPSYPSGHSVISAAAAETMTNVLGDNLAFTDTSLLEFGIASRKLTSFRHAAEEASISRLYGGIHYRFDLDNGAVAGKKLGMMVNEKLKMKN